MHRRRRQAFLRRGGDARRRVPAGEPVRQHRLRRRGELGADAGLRGPRPAGLRAAALPAHGAADPPRLHRDPLPAHDPARGSDEHVAPARPGRGLGGGTWSSSVFSWRRRAVERKARVPPEPPDWGRLELRGVTHTYRRENEEESFLLGPIDLALEPGRAGLPGGRQRQRQDDARQAPGRPLRAGGRGDPLRRPGRSTDGNREEYREHFSVVFSDFFLFEKLLGLDADGARRRGAPLPATSSTWSRRCRCATACSRRVDLSQGQRKRLALLTAYLEDRPIYLFDEWAADQDPVFKEVFYLEPPPRAQGARQDGVRHQPRRPLLPRRRPHPQAGLRQDRVRCPGGRGGDRGRRSHGSLSLRLDCGAMHSLRPSGLVKAAVLAVLLAVAAGCRTPPPVTLPPASADQRLFAEVDRLLEDFRERGAFPGGVLAVGHRGALVHLHPFGRLTYEADAPPVAADTLYDLASLTKVVATTTMAMILVDEGKLDLDRPVQDFLPGFRGPGKEAVTVRHLLTHSSGLAATAPLYQEIQGRAAYLERIQAMDLEYPPGSRSVYSDLGIILLGEILERIAGQPFETFVRERVLDPLGMRDTLFRPPAETAAPDRSDGSRSLARPADPGRGPRRKRLRPGRRRTARRALRHGARSGALRTDAAEWWNPGRPPHRLARDCGSLHPPGRHPRLRPRPRLGHQIRRGLFGRHPLFPALLRPHRLHRHLDLDRSGAAALRDPAHQPGASHAREQPDPRGAPGGGGRGGAGPHLEQSNKHVGAGGTGAGRLLERRKPWKESGWV